MYSALWALARLPYEVIMSDAGQPRAATGTWQHLITDNQPNLCLFGRILCIREAKNKRRGYLYHERVRDTRRQTLAHSSRQLRFV